MGLKSRAQSGVVESRAAGEMNPSSAFKLSSRPTTDTRNLRRICSPQTVQRCNRARSSRCCQNNHDSLVCAVLSRWFSASYSPYSQCPPSRQLYRLSAPTLVCWLCLLMCWVVSPKRLPLSFCCLSLAHVGVWLPPSLIPAFAATCCSTTS